MTELVTTAFYLVLPFSWWWLALPLGLGVVVFLFGAFTDIGGLMGAGAVVFLLGGFFAVMANYGQSSSYNEDLLRTDVAEQLQIEETVKDGDWYMGKGPDGEFVRFALVEKDGAEDTYAVLVEK